MCQFDRRRNNARSIVGQLILFFPPSFKGSRSVYIEYTRLLFYSILCYPAYDIISGYPSVSFGDLIHHTVSASVSRVRLSPGDEIFDLRFVSFFPTFFFLRLYVLRVVSKSMAMGDRNANRIPISCTFIPLICALVDVIVAVVAAVLILLVTFSPASKFLIFVQTSRLARRHRGQAGRTGRAVLRGEPVPSWLRSVCQGTKGVVVIFF